MTCSPRQLDIYIPAKFGRLPAGQAPEMVPDLRLPALALNISAFENDGLWSSSDADLIELTKKWHAGLRFNQRGAVVPMGKGLSCL
jgi:hypothetical protein